MLYAGETCEMREIAMGIHRLNHAVLYVGNLEGQTFVLDAAPKFKVLAKNDLGETTYAALAVSNGEFYLRTYKHLFCIKSGH